MAYGPIPSLGPDAGTGGPSGSSYCGIFTIAPREACLALLSELRFSGFVAPQQGDWVVAVTTRLRGAVAGRKMTAPDVASALSTAVDGLAFSVLVLDDELLELNAFSSGEQIVAYLSDPTVAFPHDDEVTPDPEGAEFAPALAAAVGRSEVADELEEVLGEELTESENESERATRILRLIGAPSWIVAAESLPKDVPTGPRAKDFTRLGAGKEGVGGRLDDAVRGIVRKKQ